MDKEEKEFDKEFVKDDVYYEGTESSRKILDEDESNRIKSFIKKNHISHSKLLDILGEDKEIIEVETAMYLPKDTSISLSGAYGYNQAKSEIRERINKI